MAGYVSLPIVCFYLFNKPEYFKENLARTKQYYSIPEDSKSVIQALFSKTSKSILSKLVIFFQILDREVKRV